MSVMILSLVHGCDDNKTLKELCEELKIKEDSKKIFFNALNMYKELWEKAQVRSRYEVEGKFTSDNPYLSVEILPILKNMEKHDDNSSSIEEFVGGCIRDINWLLLSDTPMCLTKAALYTLMLAKYKSIHKG